MVPFLSAAFIRRFLLVVLAVVSAMEGIRASQQTRLRQSFKILAYCHYSLGSMGTPVDRCRKWYRTCTSIVQEGFAFEGHRQHRGCSASF